MISTRSPLQGVRPHGTHRSRRVSAVVRRTTALVCMAAMASAVASAVASAAPLAAQVGERWQPTLSNATLTFHIIEADGFETVDPAIADVVEELQKLFRYRGYRLHTSSVLNGALDEGGRASVSQMIATPGNPDSQYRISALVREIQSDDRPKVRVFVELQEGFPGEFREDAHRVPVLIEASVNLAEEQTVVLGSARPRSDSAAIILVLTPSFERR